MEVNQAKLLIRVPDLQVAMAFYVTRLGWIEVDTRAAGNAERANRADRADKADRTDRTDRTDRAHRAVMLRAVPDYLVVVIEMNVNDMEDNLQLDFSDWLLPQAHHPEQGDYIYIGVNCLKEVKQALCERGFWELREEEDAGCIRKLFVPTPEGFTIIYWEELFPTDEDILATYTKGAEDMDLAVAGLSETELDAVEAWGKWSIRQQVLHVIDLELVTIHKVKFALAESGRAYQGNSFSQDDWCAGLDYISRPIGPELAMFRAVRQHIIGLCKHLPAAMQCTVKTSNGEESVGRLLKMMSSHATQHVRAIRRIRAKENK
ncbi:hypothetical protein GK047_18980 [Paenibacillus sp. SYP-B3998]|uniref:DinB-like domain-containing protein n=1 Tax=Paenibacillus sp. SYP-B3998 TaxID=2678564 RepID=A0A6G4A2P2_9BACL|nr:DinB family protein [Paenibacillus sp. SYP-B3998]NEW08089.1 hypothetical protein [Paenibacillus sp. SYP-B3998]